MSSIQNKGENCPNVATYTILWELHGKWGSYQLEFIQRWAGQDGRSENHFTWQIGEVPKDI